MNLEAQQELDFLLSLVLNLLEESKTVAKLAEKPLDIVGISRIFGLASSCAKLKSMKLVAFQIIFWFIPFFGFSQSSQLVGEILDSTNKEGIPLAQLELIRKDIVAREVKTDFEGQFSISNLEPGNYRLRILAIGYPNIIVDDIKIIKKKKTELSFEITTNLDLAPVEIEWGYICVKDSSGKLRCIKNSEIHNKR